MNETLAFLDAVEQGHQDYNQQHDHSEGDSKDHDKILVDVLYASIVDDDVFLDVVQPLPLTGGGDFVRDDGREVHVSPRCLQEPGGDCPGDDGVAEVSDGLRPGL